jgi:hypothetical protein
VRHFNRLFIMTLITVFFLSGCGGGGGSDGASPATSPQTTTLRGIILETTGTDQTKVAESATITAEVVTAEKPGLAKTDILTVQTNSDGSFEIPNVSIGATVTLTISKEGYTSTKKEVAVSGLTYTGGSLQKKDEAAATLTSSGGTLTTDGSDLEIPAGALSADVPNVTITSYHTAQNLPVPLPAGATPLAGVDVSAPTEVLFNAGLGASLFTEPPANVTADDLQNADIRLFEFTGLGWQERPGKGVLLSAGAHAGFLGPDPNDPATLSGLFPAVYARMGILPGTVNGTVRNTAGTPLPGVYVFGGGDLAITDSNGNYQLQRVSVLKEAGENIPLIAATSGFLAGAQVATLAPGGSSAVDFTLISLTQIPAIGSASEHFAVGTIRLTFTAALSNTTPVDADIVQGGILLGEFSLDPGESVFIIYVTDGSFSTVYALDILVLSGAVDFTIQGQTSTLNAGQDQLFIL